MIQNKIIDTVFKEFDDRIYLVGGSVRDILMEKEPKDYDFTTPLDPDEIEKIVRSNKRKPYLIGKRFGTIGFKIDGQMIEVTTFRTEKYEANNRKPAVEFVKNIHHDLSRRDFTINAMAYRKGKLHDLFNGRDDLKNGIIKFVGNPKTRIKEDPLRMLRAFRFVSQLKMLLDGEGFKAIHEKAYKILHVSKERWMLELDKLLMTDEPSWGLRFMMNCNLFNYMIPELSLQEKYNQNNPHHTLDLFEHTLRVVDATPKDINLRWAALLHDIAKPFVRLDKDDKSVYYRHDFLGKDIIEKIARHLKWSNERRETVKEIVGNHLSEDSILKEYDRLGKEYRK